MNNIRSYWLCYLLGMVCYIAALGIARQSILLSQVYTLSQIGGTPEAVGSSWNLAVMYTAIESVAMTPVLTPLLWEKVAKVQQKYSQLPREARAFSDFSLGVLGFFLLGGILWAYYSDITSVWGTLQLGSGDNVSYAVGLTLAHVFGSEVLALLGGIGFWAGRTIQCDTAGDRAKQAYLIESARIRKETALARVRTVSHRSPSETQKGSEQDKAEKDSKKDKAENNGKVDAAVTSTWGAM